MNIPSASSRQQDKNKLYHWPDFTPPQPQNAAASVAYFVTAVNRPRATVLAGMMALGIITGLISEPGYSGSDAYASVLSDLTGDLDEELEL